MRIDLLTLHPQLVQSPLDHSIMGRARNAELVEIQAMDIREHAPGKHRQCDDSPYGGGAGMVMKVDVVDAAIQAARAQASAERPAKVILMSPAGRPFTQAVAQELSEQAHLILVCGHYEGIDARIEDLVDDEISLGDFVLTGGELAALVIVDAVVRLRPGVLGNSASAQEESFSEGLLEYPQYTRPRSYKGHDVPEVLLSGNHARIDAWREEQALARTQARRPDLLEQD